MPTHFFDDDVNDVMDQAADELEERDFPLEADMLRSRELPLRNSVHGALEEHGRTEDVKATLVDEVKILTLEASLESAQSE